MKSRIVKTAAALHRAYGNADAVAYQRSKASRTEAGKEFWWRVARFLFRPYSCQSWTNDDCARWTAIRNA